VVVERWETRDDLNAHGKAPHMKVWREYSSQMKTAPTVIEIISDGKVEKLSKRFKRSGNRFSEENASEKAAMIRATHVKGQYRWTHAAADTVVLDFDDRHRRRMAMTGTRGLEFLLDLENAVALRGGDALVLEDGRLIEVVAAAEPLLEIRGADPLHLVRVAWHLGNRHLPTQIMPKGLRIRRDHVIEAMVKGLGARIIEIEAPFDPEGGAYAASHAHAPTPRMDNHAGTIMVTITTMTRSP
jgi:urease accessory protein